MHYKGVAILAASICVSACSPGAAPEQKSSQVGISQSSPSTAPSAYQSQPADAKSVAKAYGVTEDRANDVAGRAAALSGGNASKQDMLDAMKAARGE